MWLRKSGWNCSIYVIWCSNWGKFQSHTAKGQSVLGKGWQTLVRSCRRSACGLCSQFSKSATSAPHQYIQTRELRVVSKVFLTDFASRKFVLWKHSPWNEPVRREAWTHTVKAQAKSRASVCERCYGTAENKEATTRPASSFASIAEYGRQSTATHRATVEAA